MVDTRELRRFQDKAGRIIILPRRPSKQLLVLSFLASKFEVGKVYGEKEVNGILNENHNFNDSALLRRELIEKGFLERTADGREYWKKDSKDSKLIAAVRAEGLGKREKSGSGRATSR